MTAAMLALLAALGGSWEWSHYTSMTAVEDLLVEGGSVACATSGGLVFASLEAGAVSLDSTYAYPGRLSHSRVRGLARDSAGNLWACLYGGGIDVFLQGGGSEHIGLLEGLPPELEVNAVVPDTTVWAATTEGLAVRELGFFETYTPSSTGGGLPSARVLCLQPMAEGLLVGTDQGMALLESGGFPGSASSWTGFPETTGLEVRGMAADGDSVWAATSGSLLSLAVGDSSWTAVPGPSWDGVYSVDARGDTLAVGTRAAVHCRTAEGWSSDTAFLGKAVSAVEVLDGALLVGQYSLFSEDRSWGEGMFLGWPGEGWSQLSPPGIPANDLESVSAGYGSVWVGTDDNGAGYLTGGEWTRIRSELPSKSQLFSVLAQSGAGFAAPYHAGLCWVEMEDGAVADTVCWTAGEDGLINDQVVDMSQADEGSVWLAQVPFTESEQSGAVLLSWTPGEEGSETWTRFTQLEGLPSGTVNAVDRLPFDRRRAWAGTGSGAALLDAESGDVEQVLSTADGLPSSDVRALACAADGTTWLGTTAGLARLLPGGTVEAVDAVSGSVASVCPDNRGGVWVATSSALYRIGPDDQVEEITPFNSPLLSLSISGLDCDTERGLLYVATTDHGLWEVDLGDGLQGDGSGPVLYPNPFLPDRDGALRVAGLSDLPTTLRVFDLSGSLVYESQPADRSELSWDGSAEAGPAASGTYMVLVEQQGSRWLRKLAVVR
jgi:ligand-binding sensor domain-containing protein